jgi:hypothetical protein
MAPTAEEDSKNNNTELPREDSGEDSGEDEAPPPQDGGFSLAPVGDSPMTRAISGIDPKMARRMTAVEVKDVTTSSKGKQWWKDVLPKFAEVRLFYRYIVCSFAMCNNMMPPVF